jgi:hypothetical protein
MQKVFDYIIVAADRPGGLIDSMVATDEPSWLGRR